VEDKMNNAIVVNKINKSFRIYTDKPSTLKDRFLRANQSKFKEIKVLNDISFTINKGQMVGLIGQNGSGKSTLLKLLTKIIYPESGTIEINGRVSSLLELGAGFHPDFTGLENIYMSASIFGLSKEEINRRLDDIINFAEIGEFINNPVRTYSSGMYMRLAFATAINVKPDILLIDEVLAVGDASFQRKCLNRISELKNNGTTIVLVTHDHAVVERLCDKAIWLENGSIQDEGNSSRVVNNYLKYLAKRDAKREEEQIKDVQESKGEIHSVENTSLNENDDRSSSSRWGSRQIEITRVKVFKSDGLEECRLFSPTDSITIELEYKTNYPVKKTPVFGIAFHTMDRFRIYGTNTLIDNVDVDLHTKGKIRFHVHTLQLIEGDYQIDVAVHDQFGEMYDYHIGAITIKVVSEVRDVGVYQMRHTWELE
jgi:ABC-type polysaccharide/polyol phosphate transport system ATPase subunit